MGAVGDVDAISVIVLTVIGDGHVPKVWLNNFPVIEAVTDVTLAAVVLPTKTAPPNDVPL